MRNLINGRQALKQMYAKLFMLPGADAAVIDERNGRGGGRSRKKKIRLSILLLRLLKRISVRLILA